MSVSLPLWVQALDEPHRSIQARLFYIRFSALCASPDGTLAVLSTRLRRNKNYLNHLVSPGRKPEPGLLTYDDAIQIETMLGRENMPRELLRPDIFVLPESPS